MTARALKIRLRPEGVREDREAKEKQITMAEAGKAARSHTSNPATEARCYLAQASMEARGHPGRMVPRLL